ncbi:MAG TPA: hypothetical protein PK640_02220, partial [Verrucomicrobiota bacterium]|nr:hypothetical protein [Verrucomicrobiota bacterium]
MMTTRQLSWLRAAAAITAALLTVQFNRAQTVPPLEIQAPRTNQVQLLWPASTNFTILQEGLEVADPGAWVDVPEAPEVLGTRCSVLRESTNSAAYYRLVNRHGADPSAPPDPAATATAPLPNVYNDLASLTAFLYTGSNAIQVGVAPGTIKSTQASVLRGRVLQRDTSPLPGVRVVILGHPEYGYTYTRTDGRFDLAVNAAVYTVDYQAAGYCPAQRQVTLLALAYGVAPDVILVPQDALATSVQFGANAPPQVATSSPQADAAGTRSATMFIPSGTEAAMVMADGWLQPVASLTFRITEFTVGTDGPKAMPAALPPNSGYTYCADFSADEAVNAGANSIRFSQPVPVYVDNFLGVPVGTLMPVGYYDRGQGVWVPCPNGIVLQVLGFAEGAALVDLHGTGEAERADTLAANGFTTEELQHLATVSPAGKTLWRCPVPHCSSIDFNLGFSTPDSDRPTPGDKPKGKPQDTTPDRYGALHFSAQTFTERIPLAGAPFALNYASARVPDYRVDSQVTIPVAWQPPRNPCVNGSGCLQTELDPHYFDPPSAIQVEAHVEGQQSLRSLPPTNQVATVSWDGRDAYGRLVGGTRLANITISYVYSAWSYFGVSFGSGLLDQFPALFGNAGNMVSFAGHTDTEIRVGAVFQRLLTYPDHRKLGLGGWSPNPLHRLDPAGGILYYGDGRIRTVPQASVLDDFLSALGGRSRLVAAAPDGTLYFYGNYGPTGEARLFRRKPASGFEGLSVTWGTPGAVDVARDGWAKADGLPADRVVVDVSVSSLKAGPDGSLYLTDNRVIARLTPDLIWHVIMGRNATLPAILQPDGTPASESFATWANNALLAVGPDNSVYYSSWWPSYAPTAYGTNYTMVRKIAPDGRIYTVFGGGGVAATNGSPSFKALFGASAQDAHYANGWGVCGLAVGEDGVVYVSEDEINTRGIFRISLGGIVLPFLNGGPGCAEGMFDPNPADTNLTTRIKGDQGKLAIDVTDPASIPTCLQVAQDGSVYFTDGTFVWRVAPNGAVERVAGRYSQSASPPPNLPIDNGDPLNTYIYPVSDMALRSDGTLFLQRGVGNVVPATYVIPGRSALGGTLASAVSYSIPSEDASEVYVFDHFGRHLRTLDGLTGAPKWVFDYDAQSLVVSLTDAVGQVTRIERDAAGQATAIVNPYGQRTGLAMDANGFLSAVTNPAGETTRLSNSTGGLLRTITGPLGETYTVDYDELGQVIKVADPLGGGWVDSWVDKGVLEDYSYEVDINCTNSLGD